MNDEEFDDDYAEHEWEQETAYFHGIKEPEPAPPPDPQTIWERAMWMM